MNCIKPRVACKYRLPCNPSECTANICQRTLDSIDEGIKKLISLQQHDNGDPELKFPDVKPAKKSKS